ncbi:DUF6508 domain-containing protein [Pararhodobacter aggregans]|uniref:DUF6508 domain-containing protein n=1 Tax=Pararhodobacter aggregans TaxID=404875 RepID=UPI003A93C3B3
MNDREALAAMAAFLPRLKANGASFGEFVEPKKIRDRTYTMPYWRSCDLADDFVEMAYREGWVQKVDWVAWAATATGRSLLHQPGAVEDADLAQLRYLITALIRKDRFVDGTLVAAFESGLLLRVAARADALLRRPLA